MNLAELEQYFARAATSGNGPLPELDRVFLGTVQLSASERVAIYNRGYFYRLVEALASVFNETKRVLGDPEFERLGLSYVAQCPSEHPAVERVGRSFAEFLRGAGAPAVVVDLAALEWARLCALVAPNPRSVVNVDAIEPNSFPHTRLRFVPSLHWLELDPRALRLFAGESLAHSSSAEPLAARCGVAVWRSQHAVQHESLAAQEWRALVGAVAGAKVSQVCAEFDTGSEAEDVRRAFQVLSSWFARKWLESVTVSGP